MSPIDRLAQIGIIKGLIFLWGTGTPYREFLFADDLADACAFVMGKYNVADLGEFVNIGTGQDRQIKDYAEVVKQIVGFKGNIEWDTSKIDGTQRKLSDVSRIEQLGWEAKVGLDVVYEGYAEKQDDV